LVKLVYTDFFQDLIQYFKIIFYFYFADDKKYDAIFLYNSSEGIDKFTKETLKSVVVCYRSILEKQGYRVFDEKKDGVVSVCKYM